MKPKKKPFHHHHATISGKLENGFQKNKLTKVSLFQKYLYFAIAFEDDEKEVNEDEQYQKPINV